MTIVIICDWNFDVSLALKMNVAALFTIENHNENDYVTQNNVSVSSLFNVNHKHHQQ